MQFRTVYGFLPVLIFSVSNDKPLSWGDARTNGFVIRVRERMLDDEGAVRHEMVHVKQWYRMLCIFHPLLYLVWPWYRIRSEAEAFREQLKWDRPNQQASRLGQYANLLATRYGGSLTLREARDLLTP